MNRRIRELLQDLNDRPMRTYGGQSRRQLFERFDRPALKPLPRDRYRYGEWFKATANIDYHVVVNLHYYSVPYQLRHHEFDVRVSATTVEIFEHGTRIAVHARDDSPGRHSTIAEHMPKSHREHLEWSPSRMIRWAATIGPQTAALAELILASRPHPEQGYRSCLGLMRLGKHYGAERLEAASARAVRAGAKSYRHVKSILKHRLDAQQPLLDEANAVETRVPLMHEYVRGASYYCTPEGEE
jgi:transposase